MRLVMMYMCTEFQCSGTICRAGQPVRTFAVFALKAPPRLFTVAKVDNTGCIDPQRDYERMYKVSCESVHRFFRYNFLIIIAPPTG